MTNHEVVDVDVLGIATRVRGAGAAFADTFQDVLLDATHTPIAPDVELSITNDAGVCSIHGNNGLVSVCGSEEALVEHLVSVLNQVGLDHDVERLHVHAALVEIQGSGVVIAGPSGAGKSTLTAALLERGAAYLTDETISLTPGSNTFVASPKPLTLKSWSIGRFAPHTPAGVERTAIPASSVGAIAEATVAAHVIFPTYTPGAQTKIHRLSPAESLHRLLDETLDAQRFGAGAIEVLASLVGRTSSWSLEYESLDDGADLVEQIAAQQPELTSWQSRWSGRHGVTITIDDVDVTLDVKAGTVWAAPAADPTRWPPSVMVTEPDAHHEQRARGLAEALRRLKTLGIVGLVADESSLSGGRRGTQSATRPQIIIPVAPQLPEGLIDDVSILAAGLVEPAGGVLIPYEELADAALPVLIDGEWWLGLHPRHQLLRACLSFSATPTTDGAALINRLGALPEHTLLHVINEAEHFDLAPIMRAAVFDAAAMADGVSRPMVETMRRWSPPTSRHQASRYIDLLRREYPSLASVGDRPQLRDIPELLLGETHPLGSIARQVSGKTSSRTSWRIGFSRHGSSTLSMLALPDPDRGSSWPRELLELLRNIDVPDLPPALGERHVGARVDFEVAATGLSATYSCLYPAGIGTNGVLQQHTWTNDVWQQVALYTPYSADHSAVAAQVQNRPARDGSNDRHSTLIQQLLDAADVASVIQGSGSVSVIGVGVDIGSALSIARIAAPDHGAIAAINPHVHQLEHITLDLEIVLHDEHDDAEFALWVIL